MLSYALHVDTVTGPVEYDDGKHDDVRLEKLWLVDWLVGWLVVRWVS